MSGNNRKRSGQRDDSADKLLKKKRKFLSEARAPTTTLEPFNAKSDTSLRKKILSNNARSKNPKKPSRQEKIDATDFSCLNKHQRKLFWRNLRQKEDEPLKCESKKVWEQLRRHDGSKEKKSRLASELFAKVRGRVLQLVTAHDSSRVLECLVKFGSDDEKQAIFEEIEDNIVAISKSKYGKFYLKAFLKHGSPQQRDSIIRSFKGQVRKLIRHTESASVIEYAYNDFANATQRAILMEDFYGLSYTFLKADSMDVEQDQKPQQRKQQQTTFEDVMKNAGHHKIIFLKNMKETLIGVIDKNSIEYSIVHRALYDFLNHSSGQLRSEMIEAIRDRVVNLLHTRDGAHAGMICVWHGTKKDRKVIIKSLKGHVLKICKEKYGHMILLAIFDVVDQMELVSKIIIKEISKSIFDVSSDQFGRKVLLYLLHPRDPKHFLPETVRLLLQGDENTTSKKMPVLRRSELLAAISPALLQLANEHFKEMIGSSSSMPILVSILTHVQGNVYFKSLTGPLTNLAERVALPYAAPTATADSASHILETPSGHMVIKALLVHDKLVFAKRKEDAAALPADVRRPTFAEILMSHVPKNGFRTWIHSNRGCFTLLLLLETGDQLVTRRVKEELRGSASVLKKMACTGAELLLVKYNSLRR